MDLHETTFYLRCAINISYLLNIFLSMQTLNSVRKAVSP
jgi:hypothetical protein